MINMHELDHIHLDAVGLPALRAFRAVVECGSFTKAGQQIGLGQSATSRVIAQLEESMGVSLFERTTRKVTATKAGAALYSETGAHMNALDRALAGVSHTFGDAPPVLRIGICHSVGLAYLPGLFHAYTKAFPEVVIETANDTDAELSAKLASGELDLAIVTTPQKALSGTSSALTFPDPYVLIAPESLTLGNGNIPLSLKRSRTQLATQRWLGLPPSDPAAKLLQSHFDACGIKTAPALTADSYDLLINLVALEMGIACVPNRALAIYRRQRRLQVIPIRPKFSRELAVLTRKSRKLASHVRGFIDRMLFALK